MPPIRRSWVGCFNQPFGHDAFTELRANKLQQYLNLIWVRSLRDPSTKRQGLVEQTNIQYTREHTSQKKMSAIQPSVERRKTSQCRTEIKLRWVQTRRSFLRQSKSRRPEPGLPRVVKRRKAKQQTSSFFLLIYIAQVQTVWKMVGAEGLEPPIRRLWAGCFNQLS